jgi:UDP-glucose 4-epimerase
MERVIPLFIKKINAGEPVTVFGRNKTLDFTYIDDCVSGIIAGIEKLKGGQIKNQTFNLAYGEGHTLIAMAEFIGRALDKTPTINVEESKKVGEVSYYIANIGKAKQLLGYNPQTPLAEGTKKAVAWWKEYYNYR